VGATPPDGVPAGPTNFRADAELLGLFTATGFETVGISHIMFEAAVPDTGTLWLGLLESAVRVPSLVVYQAPDVQASIRSAFDDLCAVHRRPDGTLAIPVSVQVTRGRRP
jgi:hypothetical protein